MTGVLLALADRDDALTPHGYAFPESGPVPDLTQRIVELLRLEAGDLVIDLCGAASSFGEQLARLVSASGVHTVQMSALTFGRFPMRYDKVLLRGGFSGLRDHGRLMLSRLFERLDPAARILAVDSAPSQDAPLFSDGLRRWKRQHCPAEAIACVVREAGFAPETALAECVRRVPAALCRAWIASRAWPVLEAFSDGELERGLRELRGRYGSQAMVTFTSRFELVLGSKPAIAAAVRPGRA